jgi:hypothetical protein
MPREDNASDDFSGAAQSYRNRNRMTTQTNSRRAPRRSFRDEYDDEEYDEGKTESNTGRTSFEAYLESKKNRDFYQSAYQSNGGRGGGGYDRSDFKGGSRAVNDGDLPSDESSLRHYLAVQESLSFYYTPADVNVSKVVSANNNNTTTTTSIAGDIGYYNGILGWDLGSESGSTDIAM